MDRLQNDAKGRREPVGIGYIFEFYKSDPRYKRLLLLVPNFNATSDENGVIDQSCPCQWQFQGLQRKSYTSNRVFGIRRCCPFLQSLSSLSLLRSSTIRPVHRLVFKVFIHVCNHQLHHFYQDHCYKILESILHNDKYLSIQAIPDLLLGA